MDTTIATAIASALSAAEIGTTIRTHGACAYYGTDGDYQQAAGLDDNGDPQGYALGITIMSDTGAAIDDASSLRVLATLATMLGAVIVAGTAWVDASQREAGAIVRVI